MTTNPEERARELPSKVGLERELHRAWSKQSRCLGCSKPAELLWPIVEQWLTQARLAALEEVSHHKAADYNGRGYDWVCDCGAKGHWTGEEDTWANHIRALAQAAAPAKGDK